jgi:hypothetical protein
MASLVTFSVGLTAQLYIFLSIVMDTTLPQSHRRFTMNVTFKRN